MTPRVLFVCLGNICRSPAAEGVFIHMAAARGLKAAAESAGTGGWHVGAPPDARMRRAAAGRGYDLDRLRARKLNLADYYDFDHLLAMDESVLADLKEVEPSNGRARVSLFLDFAEDLQTRDVPDPYYGRDDGFEHVLDLIEAGVDGLLDHLTASSE